MNFHSRSRASAYLIIIHLLLGVIGNALFFHLDYASLLKIILIPIVLFDASSIGFFLIRGFYPKHLHDSLFGGATKLIGFLVWALVLFCEFIIFKRADPLWVYILLSVSILMRFKGDSIPKFHKDEFFFSELSFLISFYLSLSMASFFPEIFSGEKAMDAGLLGQYMRYESGDLWDPWFAGKAMGYYTFGYFSWANLLKLFSLPLASAYHVALALVAALSGQLLYGLYALWTKQRVVSLCAALLTLMLPNFFAVKSLIFSLMGAKSSFAAYWSQTRIYPNGYFAEYPFWSFSFGDLHPHVMNYPLVIGFFYFLLLTFRNEASALRTGALLVLSLVWGTLMMTNLWDGPMIAVTLIPLSIIFAWSQLMKRSYTSFKDQFAILVGSAMLSLFALALALYQMGPSIAKTVHIKALGLHYWQASFAHCGWMILLSLALFVFRPKRTAFERLYLSITLGLLLLFVIAHFLVLMDQINTIFKTMTYLSLASSIVLVAGLMKYLNHWRLSVPIIVCVACAYITLSDRSHARVDVNRRVGLDGSSYLKSSSRADYEIVKWIEANVRGNQLIVEFPGRSFLYGTPRVSMLTGLSNYLGWDYHVQLRGADAAAVEARKREIRDFYESEDVIGKHQWARAQGIRYFILSEQEYMAYPGVKLNSFEQYTDHFKVLVKVGRGRLFEVL